MPLIAQSVEAHLRYQLLSFVMTLYHGTYWARTSNLPLGLLEVYAWCLLLPQCRALRYLFVIFRHDLVVGNLLGENF